MKDGIRIIPLTFWAILLGFASTVSAENLRYSAPLPACSFTPFINASQSYICEGDTVTLTTNSGNYSYQWYKDGAILSSDTLINLSATDTGSYKVIITDSSGTCSDSAFLNLAFGTQPSLIISFSDTSVCFEDQVTLTGSGAQNLTWSGGISNGVAFQATQDKWYHLTGQDTNGCATQDSIFIEVFALPTLTVAIADDTICSGDTTRLTASGAQTYLWTQQVTNGIDFVPTSTQSYIVFGTDSNSCKSSDTVEVVVHNLPALNLGNDTSICPYDSVLLEAPTAFIESYLWSSGNTSSSIYASSIGNHSVTITDSNGCVNVDTLTLAHDTLPESYIRASDTICNGDQYSLSAEVVSNYGYLWSKDSISSPLIQLTTAGVYYLTVTDQSGCFQVDTFELEVLALPVVSFTAAIPDQCTNNKPLALSGGSPIGGSYSSTSSMVANDSLWPSSAGILPITYSYTDTFNCTNTADTSVTIFDPPVVSLSSIPDLCFNGPVDTIAENSPKGGYFFSTLIWTDDTGYVDPTLNSPGTYQVAYTYTDTSIGCSDTAFNTLVIHDTIGLSFTSKSWCENIPLQLIGEATGIPANLNGVYSGTGVQSGQWFDPSVGFGSYDLGYQLTDSNSCTSSSVRTVSVDSIPLLQFSINDICSNVDPVRLNATPAGGTFSGTGLITGDSLDPGIPAVGLNSIAYAYTDGSTTCSDTISAFYSVFAVPTVTFEIPDTVVEQCLENDSVFLSGNTPVGGNFSGTGLTSGNKVFNPDTAGAGTHEIVYTYTDANGCVNSDKDSIVVYNRPVLSFTFPDSLCFNNGGFPLVGATPSGGIYSGSGVDSNGIFDPVVAGVSNNHNIQYYYLDTATGCNNSITESFRVDSVTYITLGLIPEYCLNYPKDTLSQGSFHTPGFKYEGFGIIDSSVFDPSVAGVGSGTVEYIYTNTFGCRDTAQQVVTVHDLPVVNVNIPVAYQNWCQNAGLIPLNFATPAGGIYSSVSGISGNSFDPLNAVLGNNDLIYTYTDTNNCQHADTGIVEIDSVPVVSVSGNTFCLNEGYLTLNSGSPAGGFYQGPGMVSNTIFNPAIAGVGNKTIKYTYQAPNGCSESATSTHTVNALPVVSFASPPPVCLNAGAYNLSGATTNGSSFYFAGTGITDSILGTFDPQIAGADTHEIRYIASLLGCRDTVVQLLRVDTVPVVTLGTIPDTCANAFSFQLNQGSPSSGGTGIYTGRGVTGSYFNPQLVTPGADTIWYTYTDFNGCQAKDSSFFNIDTLPVVGLKPLPIQCFGGDSLVLDTFGSPLGGIFTGTYVSANTDRFVPSTIGTSTVTYTFTDSKGCSGSQSQFITVNALPAVSLTFDSSFCENAGPQPLQGGFPPGGSYRADGIDSILFIPDSVHSFIDTLYYTYSDAFGCKDSVWKEIRIDTLEDVNTTPVPDLCKGDPSIDLEPYASPKGGTFAGVSIFGSTFVPNLLDTGTYLYQYTYTDTNQCTVQVLDTIRIRPVPDLQTTSDPSLCVGESVTLSATGGLSFSWSTGQFGPSIQVAPATSTNYQVESVNEFNCKITKSIQVTVFDRYQVFTTGLPADCGQANGSGVISASGGASPYSYFWSDGDRNGINRNLFAGTYQVTVVDKNQCTEYATVNISNRNGPSINLDSIQNNACFGDSEGMLLVSASGGTGDLSFNWSNGFQSDSLSGLPAGKYDLTVVDEKGCLAVRTYEITEGQRLSIESMLSEPLCDSASGQIIVAPSISGDVYTFTWLHGPVGDTLKNLGPGTYSLALADTNQCTDTLHFDLSTSSIPDVRVDSLFSTWCGTDTGAIFTTPLDTAYSYQWSTGDTTTQVTQLAQGTYTMTVSDSLGCTRITTLEIEQEAPAPLEICLVTNDTALGQNVVIWDTTGRSGDQLYRIYRESGIKGKYYELGTVLPGQRPMFRDSTLFNQTLSGNYQVTSEDACNQESELGSKHSSILLSGERIPGNGVQLSWSNYTGIQVPKYYLYRFTTTRGLELLDSVGTTFPTYTDYGAPAKEDEIYHYYFVSADPLTHCDPTYPMILSNYSFNFGKGPSTGIAEVRSDWGMKIWPNPNQGEFTLRLNGTNGHPMTVRLFDQQGKIHHQQHLDAITQTQDISVNLYDISAGVYYLQVVSNGNVKTERVSINP